jgi:hypothetical protein
MAAEAVESGLISQLNDLNFEVSNRDCTYDFKKNNASTCDSPASTPCLTPKQSSSKPSGLTKNP